LRITDFEWDEENIDHIGRHGVSPEEVEEACYERPFVLKGREGLYLVYSQTMDGRYLLVVTRYRGNGKIRVITARDMTDAEKRLCRERRR
jgi:uncharacterized protein